MRGDLCWEMMPEQAGEPTELLTKIDTPGFSNGPLSWGKKRFSDVGAHVSCGSHVSRTVSTLLSTLAPSHPCGE